ncbi:MAG: carboxypeptidase-like regulatory domain-containing protein [Coprobacter fastidiosus]
MNAENLKLRSLGILLLMCLFSFGVYAQGRQVSGTVTDAKGEPQIGVSVGVKGTTQGTMTDIDGKFNESSFG